MSASTNRDREGLWLDLQWEVADTLARCRQLLGTTAAPSIAGDTSPPSDYRDRYEKLTGSSLRECPVCHQGHMIPAGVLEPLGGYPERRDIS